MDKLDIELKSARTVTYFFFLIWLLGLFGTGWLFNIAHWTRWPVVIVMIIIMFVMKEGMEDIENIRFRIAKRDLNK